MSGQQDPSPDDQELYRRIAWCVNAAAKPIYRRYRFYIHIDDARQEAWAWALEHRDWTAKALERSDAYLVRRLRGVVERYGRREKAARSGYSPSDEAYYSLARIADLLPEALDPEGTPPTGSSSEVRGNSELYMEWETSIADIRAALKQLPAGWVDALREWVERNPEAPIADGIQIILRQIQAYLGGARPEAGEKK